MEQTPESSPDPSDVFEPNGASETLVVLLHAYTQGPRHLDHVAKVIRDQLPDADLFRPSIPIRRLFSLVPLHEMVRTLLRKLDRVWTERLRRTDGRSYGKVILVGHSLGGILARKLYLVALGTVRGGRAPR